MYVTGRLMRRLANRIEGHYRSIIDADNVNLGSVAWSRSIRASLASCWYVQCLAAVMLPASALSCPISGVDLQSVAKAGARIDMRMFRGPFNGTKPLAERH